MAEVSDVLNNATGGQSFAIPGGDNKPKTKFIPYVKGEYLCHIIESETKIVNYLHIQLRLHQTMKKTNIAIKAM